MCSEVPARDTRLIIANLDAESDFATMVLGRSNSTARQAARVAAAEAGSLLRVFARPGDELGLLEPIAHERLVALADVPCPAITTVQPAVWHGPRLAWARTQRLGTLRGRDGAVPNHPAVIEADPLHEALWRMPTAPAEAAAACNDRRLALTLGRQLETASPYARLVASWDDVLGAAARVKGPWVVKARFSAAGRARYIHREGIPSRARVDNLHARHGALVFEPWVDRVADFGASVVLDAAGGARLVGFHQQYLDQDGRFRGLEMPLAHQGFFGLGETECLQMDATIEAVAGALHQRGYVGPFGIDAWRYRDEQGGMNFQPLGEINARMTFGFVARAWIDRLRPAFDWPDNGRIRLCFGASVPEGAIGLLRPPASPQRGGAIWLEVAT